MDPTIALHEGGVFEISNKWMDKILQISPEATQEERQNRIVNAVMAISSACFMGVELAASPSIDRAWTVYVYSTDMAAHLGQALLSKDSHPALKASVLGLNVLRLTQIYSTVTNVFQGGYHLGKFALTLFHGWDTISHAKNAWLTLKMFQGTSKVIHRV